MVVFGECLNEKIFILTGEPSGDKLASKVIGHLKRINPSINFICGWRKSQVFRRKKYLRYKRDYLFRFHKCNLNLFKINKKINQTVKAIIDYSPDILFTVDSPDFTLRVAQRVKK